MITIRENLPRHLDEADTARLVQEIQRTFERKIVCGEHGAAVRSVVVEGMTVTCTPCCDDVAPIVKRTLALLVPNHFERS